MKLSTPIAELKDAQGQPLDHQGPVGLEDLIGAGSFPPEEVFAPFYSGMVHDMPDEHYHWRWLLYQLERDDVLDESGKVIVKEQIIVAGLRTLQGLIEEFTKLKVKLCLGEHEQYDQIEGGPVFRAETCAKRINNPACWHCLDSFVTKENFLILTSLSFRLKALETFFTALGRQDLVEVVQGLNVENIERFASNGDSMSDGYFNNPNTRITARDIQEKKKVFAERMQEEIIDPVVAALHSLLEETSGNEVRPEQGLWTVAVGV